MAVATVTAQNLRLEDGEANTGWSSIGGGQSPSSEGSFYYQGGKLVNKKITGTGGVAYDPTGDGGSSLDLTTPAQSHWMIKAIVSDYGGLNAVSGARALIGSSNNAYHVINLAGSAAAKASLSVYPKKGGFIILPINPNIAGYRETTNGAPNLAIARYFGFEANFDTSTAKAENVGLDAIDFGTGLTITGGDGADPDAKYSDFIAFDEGVITNRFGYVQSLGGSITIAFGTLKIGGPAATVFTDTSSNIIWPEGLFAAGFSKVLIDLQNAATVVSDGSTQTSLGTTAVEDTRADYQVTGTAGTFSFSGVLNNFRNITYNSKSTVIGASIQCVSLTQGGATITNSEIRTNSTSGAATLVAPSMSLITNTSFRGNQVGHAIEITSPGSYTFDGISFSNYGVDGSNAAAIYNNSGGAVTINIAGGGDSPTVRNGSGATTDIVLAASLTLTGIPNGAEVRLRQGTFTVDYIADVTGNIYVYGYSVAQMGGKKITISVGSSGYIRREETITLGSTSQTLPFALSPDPSYI